MFPTDNDRASIQSNAYSYRVNFWVKPPRKNWSWSLDAYILFGVPDVREVLAWVDEHSKGRQAEVFIELDGEPPTPFETPRRANLVRIMGTNPNEVSGTSVSFTMVPIPENQGGVDQEELGLPPSITASCCQSRSFRTNVTDKTSLVSFAESERIPGPHATKVVFPYFSARAGPTSV